MGLHQLYNLFNEYSLLYVTLKTQYEKAKIDEIGREEMGQQIDGPSIPTELTKPRRALSIVLASFFGFFKPYSLIS